MGNILFLKWILQILQAPFAEDNPEINTKKTVENFLILLRGYGYSETWKNENVQYFFFVNRLTINPHQPNTFSPSGFTIFIIDNNLFENFILSIKIENNQLLSNSNSKLFSNYSRIIETFLHYS